MITIFKTENKVSYFSNGIDYIVTCKDNVFYFDNLIEAKLCFDMMRYK